ncbi:MAG: hypothetical protein CM1200mP31_1020 [Candidatus Neomarinimicrobiota bacterium]|nr:MAG: hypothetical protein CM1200mP31_1020 [Candidatus Neomarinimicrobiota bacterium]
MLFLISIIIMKFMLTGWAVMNYQASVYFIPIVIASMLLTYCSMHHFQCFFPYFILLFSLLIGNNLDFTIMQFFIVFISIYSVRRLRKRRQIITPMFYWYFLPFCIFLCDVI